MFSSKKWGLGGLKGLMKKLTTQALLFDVLGVVDLHCPHSTCVVNFLISAFSPSRLQFLLRNSLSNRCAPNFLFSRKDLIKYLSLLIIANSHH